MSEKSSNNPASSGRFQRMRALIVVAALVAVVGIVLILLPTEQATVGWFAYSPLPQTIFVPDAGVLLTPRMMLGLALAVLGALVLAACGGWSLARRRDSRSMGAR